MAEDTFNIPVELILKGGARVGTKGRGGSDHGNTVGMIGFKPIL